MNGSLSVVDVPISLKSSFVLSSKTADISQISFEHMRFFFVLLVSSLLTGAPRHLWNST